MLRLLAILTALTVAMSCSQEEVDQAPRQRMERVENGLLEFRSPALMFQPDSAQLANPRPMDERMLHYKVPGVSVAVINDCEVEWVGAYGIMDANTGTPVTSETIFEAASTSKMVTTVLALHFVQNGLIDLDTDVNAYLKSWKVPENEFTETEKVTLRRLLTHEAGLPSTNFGHDETGGYPTLIDVLNGAPPALNRPAVPELVPGAQWQYSNVGYDVIQMLLEDVSGKDFEQIAEEVVFVPLAMDNSSFEYPLDSEKSKREAMPHDAEGVSLKPQMHLTALAHGNLTTTPTDLAKLTGEILLSYRGESEMVLSQEMARQLLSKQLDLDPGMFGVAISEGLGVLLMGEGEDMLFLLPGSNLPGLNCWLAGWPERGTGAVVMTNGAMGEVLAMEILSSINLEYNRADN